MSLPIPPINTNPANFSPQQSDPNSEINRRPKRTSSQTPEANLTQTKTEEVADAVLTANEQAPTSFWDQAKEMVAEIENGYKQFHRPIISLKQPFWFVKSLQNAYQTYMGTAPADPFLEKRRALQEAIETITDPKEFFQTLIKKVENPRLLQEPLPNGHLPLNYAIFKGNAKGMEVLLGLDCNVEQRDFQAQTALDVAYVTGNEEIQKSLKDFIVAQQKAQWLHSLKGKKPEEIDEKKVRHVLQEIEKRVDKVLAERTIVDPLALSLNDKVACAAAILWIVNQTFSDFGIMKNSYTVNYILPGLVGITHLSEMAHVWENAAHLPTMLRTVAALCPMVPSLQFVYKPFKTAMMSLSLLNSYKMVADNYKLRKWDSLIKLGVSSLNFYHSWTYNPEKKEEPIQKEEKIIDLTDEERKVVCKSIKGAISKLHSDTIKGENPKKLLNNLFTSIGNSYDKYCKVTQEFVTNGSA